jgi:hypothetical protein
MNLIGWLTVIPGIAALMGSAVTYGILLNRVRNVEGDVVDMRKELAELRATRETVARIDERTKFVADQVGSMDAKLNNVIGALLRGAETRSFHERTAS